MPYSNCIYRKLEDSYVFNLAKLNRCNPYIKSGISYDSHGLSVAAAKKIINKKRYLEHKEEAAKDKLINL
ncbi:hypothetical protein DER46DRAFT_664814 [Fusarium sp. MPI-SDFR-AT-0072]|nr:hypothetical protein DER46DRAFT_664814 [Fusarium sp. MPI-SDFR-AT-0072]